MRIDRTAEEVSDYLPAVVEPGLLRLLQLSSSTLPVGAYSYSQGLESAVARNAVRDADSAERWIGDHLAGGIARFEAPVWWRIAMGWQAGALDVARHWNDLFVATRDTAESRAETTQMGRALAKLARSATLLDPAAMDALEAMEPIAWPTAFAALSVAFAIPPGSGLAGYLWSWIESQVLAAMKAIPLGQVAGQRLLGTLAARVPSIVAVAGRLADADLNSFLPGLAIDSCHHETQYSRIFRS